jgi:hypothetical protein
MEFQEYSTLMGGSQRFITKETTSKIISAAVYVYRIPAQCRIDEAAVL